MNYSKKHHLIGNTVYIIDEDAKTRETLQLLFESVGLSAQLFENTIDFMSQYRSNSHGCIIVDVSLPEMKGLELLETLKNQRSPLSVIAITSCASVSVAVRAMKAGAVDFILKPLNQQYLLEQTQKELCKEQVILNSNLAEGFASLTPREHDILVLIADGKLNKQIANFLNIALSTVEVHRSRLMKKMQAKTLAQLIKNYVLMD